jgi:hypothetical protein
MSNTANRTGERPEQRIAALLASARAVGVTCLDTTWLGAVHRYRFRCPSGHEWVRRAGDQMANPSCPACVRASSALARRKLDNLHKLRELARTRGGVCLSKDYTGVADRVAFRCVAGHEWETQAYTALNGSWCKLCDHDAKRWQNLLPDGLDRLRRVARDKGGECLSDEYLGSRARYRFRCAEGHEWEKAATRFVTGSWCGACREGARRWQVESSAHDIARARGGRCLSGSFINTKAKLRWLCHRGHEWIAPLGRIRDGHWCPDCANMALISNRKSKAGRRYEAVDPCGQSSL